MYDNITVQGIVLDTSLVKEYDKRKAEDRLAKKIAKEMLDEKEKRENQKEDI